MERHPSAALQVTRPFKGTPRSTKPRLSSAQLMHNRIVEMQKRALLRAAKREERETNLIPKIRNDSSTNNATTATSRKHPSLPMPGSSGISYNGNYSNHRHPSMAAAWSSQKIREQAFYQSSTPAQTKLQGLNESNSSAPRLPDSNSIRKRPYEDVGVSEKTPYSGTHGGSSKKRPHEDVGVSDEKTLNTGGNFGGSSFSRKRPHEAVVFSEKTPDTSGGTSGGPSDDKNNDVVVSSGSCNSAKRKARAPSSVNLKQRPLIDVTTGDCSDIFKVPINVRQRYLNLIIDEFLKFCPEETAFQKGLEEEQEVYKKATNQNIYLRIAVNSIIRIRKDAAHSQPSPSSSKQDGLCDNLSAMAFRQSHVSVLGGSRAAKTSYTLNRSGSSRDQIEFRGLELYTRLKKYILTEEQLRANCFPRPSEDGRDDKAKYYKTEVKDGLMMGNERLCRRCGKRYDVKGDGSPVRKQTCFYHYKHAYRKKGSLVSRYDCCYGPDGDEGCQTANSHVHKSNMYDDLTGYLKTLPALESDPKNTRVLSLDCEMVYTDAGMDLARVTVIGDNCEVLYESLVKPSTAVLDYNTRFSGITAKDMEGVQTTLRDVHDELRNLVSDKTILIGHSLESDLTALKMIHSTVVDTSLVFPHRRGLPYKRALRNLAADHLQKIIQADDGGHDSKEDAVSCMQLVLFKVKQDDRNNRRF